jgi:transcriptional regulator with XRE-family HTH domain
MEVISMTQGERVREIRKKLDLTLEKFGEKLGVGRGAISAIELGNRNLTDQMAKSICREYNVSYDYLIYGEGDPFDDLPQTILDELCIQYELDDIDRQIIDLYISLPKELRDKVKAYVLDKLKK